MPNITRTILLWLTCEFPKKNLDLTLPHFFIASIPKKSSQTIFFSYVVWLVRLERCVWCSYPLDPPAKKSLSPPLLFCRAPAVSFLPFASAKNEESGSGFTFPLPDFFFTRSPDAWSVFLLISSVVREAEVGCIGIIRGAVISDQSAISQFGMKAVGSEKKYTCTMVF